MEIYITQLVGCNDVGIPGSVTYAGTYSPRMTCFPLRCADRGLPLGSDNVLKPQGVSYLTLSWVTHTYDSEKGGLLRAKGCVGLATGWYVYQHASQHSGGSLPQPCPFGP